MKTRFTLLLITFFLISIFPTALLSEKPDEYNNAYCHDPDEIARWQRIIKNNAGNDEVQALHALWLGLCVKVEYRQITVNRANEIFEKARTELVKKFPKRKLAL